MSTGGRREVVFEFPLSETLTVSFQRYPCPAAGVVSALPRSWGALPVAETGPLELAVPVPEGEAVWLGLRATAEARRWRLAVVAHLDPGGPTDAVTGLSARVPDDLAVLVVPPRRQLEGIARPDGGWWALTRVATALGAPSCRGLEILTAPDGAPRERLIRVRLTEPGDFAADTGGDVPPLRADASYGGWRLP